MAGRGRPVRQQQPDPKKIPDFTQQDLVEIKEAFDIFDKGASGVVDLGEMLNFFDVIKVHEKNPTVYRWVESVYEVHPEGVTFKDLMETLQANIGNINTPDGLATLFQIIDVEGKEYLDKERLKELAREIGETVPEEELDDLIENYYECPNGNVDIDSFVKMMLKSAI